MYARNPYGAAVQDYKSKESSSKGKEEKPHDAVLSRVPKRPQVSKPPVKFSMAPRYRFALPDPPTDLKMLRGELETSPDSALQMNKLEYEAKKVAVPLHPSFGLNVDLVMPGQYSPRESYSVSPEDQVLLSMILSRETGAEAPLAAQIGPSSLKDSAVGTFASSRKQLPADRLPLPRPTRAAQPAAFPWMRRMSYDEYFTSTKTNESRRSVAATVAPVDVPGQKESLAASRRKIALESFEKARSRSIVHPDKSKSHLKVVSNIPVFRDVDDINTELISMQFDQFILSENVPKFAEMADKAEAAFRSAVTISIADDADRKFLSCYVPENAADELSEGSTGTTKHEWQERIREFAIRDATGAQQGSSQSQVRQKSSLRRAKRSFVLTVIEEEDNNVAILSEVPSAFLLVPRPGVLPALAKPALELTREADTHAAKRRRRDAVVHTLISENK